ncbi:hypothetical protein [Nostoc sp.]|uniref:hypothetical protein n=1 Tax=Nostoc sp. TaxID=1180 RepID=UPI002FF6CA7B
MMNWLKIWLLTPALLLVGISINEILLRQAEHEPSITSNADLFCDVYSQVKKLGANDVILLGASRMQTGFDLKVFQQQFPARKSILLAQSGRGTSYPVFEDIVNSTDFKGIIIIDETEGTLISHNYDQKGFVDHCHRNFSLNRQLNHRISALLENKLVFLNPESSSLRLWTNLVIKHELPEPFYTKTLSDREQLTDYERADVKFLKEIHDGRLKGIEDQVKQSFVSPEKWLQQTEHWQTLVDKFHGQGGRVIFVRMPVSQERWKFERKITPPERYWKRFVNKLNVESVHFADYPDLSNFKLPDTSHLDMRDKPVFTRSLLTHVQDKFK